MQRDASIRVLDAVLLEDLEPLFLPGARDPEDRDLLRGVVPELDARLDHAAGDDVHAGVGDDRHHHRDLVHAGLLEDELGQPACLAHRRVAADLAVVGRVAAVGADRVEQRQRPAAGADHQAEVPAELGDVSGHAAVILGVDLLAGELERRRLARQARLLVADPELMQQRLLARPRLVLHVHVGVERDERTVLELAERVDLGQRHVVLEEQAREPGDDRRQPVQRAPADAERGDQLLGLPLGERRAGREVAAGDVVGVLLGDLLDVDPAHVGEQHHRALADPVPDHARVVLVRDRGPRVDEHAARHVAADLEVEDVLGVVRRLVGRVGELDPAGLHPAAAQDLGLDHDRPADLLGDPAGLVARLGEPVLGYGDPGLGDDRARFVLEEAHRAPEGSGAGR